MSDEPVVINCKNCKGIGWRDVPMFLGLIESKETGDFYLPMSCAICKGTGKVVLNES